MPDGKTFLEAGGVVDEIVDVRAEEASVFAGPFGRRSSQRLIAKDAIARVFVGGQSAEQKCNEAVMGGPTKS